MVRFGMQVQPLNQFRSFHGNRHSRRIIDGAGSQIPGIKMPGNDYHLLGMLRALEVRDDVVAQNVRPGL